MARSRRELIITLSSCLIPIIACILMVQLRQFSGPLFQSVGGNGWVQGWIDDCRNRGVQIQTDLDDPRTINQGFALTGQGIDEYTTCSTFLRCVLSRATNDYPSYWSAGASILGFLPTIVALMSNSIDEIVSIADESLPVALLLALSSSASFTSRFTTPASSISTSEHSEHYIINLQKTIKSRLEKSLAGRPAKICTSRLLRPYNFALGGAAVVLLVCAGAIWYFVWTLGRYGIVVWACPVKFHLAAWVALSQLLVLLSIAFRSLSFQTRRIRVRVSARTDGSDPAKDSEERAILLRCPRDDWKRWVVQTAASVFSYALYTLATVVLASMLFITPIYAIYSMVVFGVAGGVGRLVGHWASSSLRIEKPILVFDVSEIHMKELENTLKDANTWKDFRPGTIKILMV